LFRDDILLPNGQNAVREIVEHSGGCAVICEKDGKILLVRQYRYAYQKELLEIPAGKINPNESFEETAIRELEEETGLKATKVEKLFEVYPSPGYTNEIIKIYRAVEFEKGQVHLDEDEFLSAVWVEKDKLSQMIKDGQIKDAKTLIALLHVL
jgi:ADP-ribose pyrophosphatase